MHNFYSKLNILSKERLIDYDKLRPDFKGNLFNMYYPDILSKEANVFFKDHKLTPQFIINFITPLSRCPGNESTRVLHTDNRTINGVRCPIICGINYEISEPTDTTWVWYNMDKVPRTYREHTDHSDIERDIKMRAEVFNSCGVPEGAIAIEKLSYRNEIYLVRTDLPHMVTFNSYGKPRSSISIRFEQTWDSWEECYEKFKPLMTNN